MRSPDVVETDVPAKAFAGGRYAFIGAQVDLLIFDGAPEAFDEDIVSPCAFAVHADLDIGILERFDEVDGCKLRSLIGVHDLRRPEPPHSFIQRLQAWPGFQRDRELPGQHFPAEPVDHGKPDRQSRGPLGYR